MKLIVSVIFLLMFGNVFSQFTAQFNSFMFNGLAINPAYTGTRECLSLVALHSSQWVGFEGAPISDFVAIHSPVNNNHSIGLNLSNDRLGVRNQTGIFANYAYNMKVNKNAKLSFGLNAGFNLFTNKNSDVKTMTADNVFAENSKVVHLPNIGAGLYYYSEKFFLGLSAPSIFSTEFSNTSTKKSASFNSKTATYIMTIGGIVSLNEKINWKPSLLFKTITTGIFQADLNSNFYFNNKLNIGVSYRIKDALVAMVGYRFSDKFELAYSYAFPMSEIIRTSFGSHELMLKYEWRNKVNTSNPRLF